MAIIGCGAIAGEYDETKKDPGCYTHAGAYRRLPGVEIVAAADPDSGRRDAFGRFWKVGALFADVADLLTRHEADVVSVCVPDRLHEAVIDQVLTLRPPRVIFAEKPLAMSAPAARRLLDRARAAGTRIVVNNQRRWEVGHRRAADLVRRGGIGDVVAMTAMHVKGLYHVGCTAVDTIRFLAGEVTAVQALGGDHTASVVGDPSVDAALYLAGGATAMLLGVDRYGYRYSLFEIDILGTAGRIRITDNGDRISVSRVVEYAHYPGFMELRETNDHAIVADMGAAIPAAIADVVVLARGEAASVPGTGEEAWRDLCVLDAIAASRLAGGRRVDVTSA